MKAFRALLVTEAKLALRGGDMPLFGIAFPLGVMLLVGAISSPEATRLAFAGVAATGICASGLMGLPLTLAGYRHAKILRRFQVTPVSPFLLLLAVSAVQAIFAALSWLAVFLAAKLAYGVVIDGSALRMCLTFAFSLFSIFSLGYLVASLAPNERIANIACSVLYFPALFLSGTTVPYEILPRGLRFFSNLFPITQAIKLLKAAALDAPLAPDLWRFAALAAMAIACCAISVLSFRWE